MPYTTINKQTDYFNTNLWTGNGADNRAITGVGFQPDWVWIKNRDSGSMWHQLQDAVRGSGKNIYSNRTNAESATTTALKSFDSDGFTIGTSTGVNENGSDTVSWSWKAGNSNTSVSASGSGNGAYNACTHRANTTAGFSIVKYTGRNSEISNGQHTRVTHGLGAKPHFIITKALSGTVNWIVQGKDSNDANVHLNTDDAISGSEYIGDNRLSTLGTTYFNAGNDNMVNENGVEFISYVFTSIPGFSKFGTYTGNGSADGAFVYTGFKPAFFMTKRTDATGSWMMYDATRDPFNLTEKYLRADLSDAEATGSNNRIDILSNGIKLKATGSFENASGGTYIYMAFGQSLVGSNNTPCTAR